MQEEEVRKRQIISPVTRDDVVKQEREEQYRNADQGNKEGLAQLFHPGFAVYLTVGSRQNIQQHPESGYEYDAIPEIRIGQDDIQLLNNTRINRILAIDKEETPGQHG